MPLIYDSTYKPPPGFFNGHLQTVFPTVFRKVTDVPYERRRINTPDGDFLCLDWHFTGGDRLVVLLHGLEGHSRRSYVAGMIRAFGRRGWDGLAVNFRGCGGEPNLLPRLYHSGDTDDLHTVLRHIVKTETYRQIALVGFSLGGNIVLKYLGERRHPVPDSLVAAVTFSVPCDLASGAVRLGSRENAFYLRRFLRMLREKIRAKKGRFPNRRTDPALTDVGFESIRTFKEFDDRYTAPLHGFKNAEDYWQNASSKPHLSGIGIPTLLVSARNDPFLTHESIPTSAAENSRFLYLETPASGGHVGFIRFGSNGEYWSETRAAEFISAFSRD